MAEIFSLPASTSLLKEFNALAPKRNETQDGTIGDRAHMERNSDHNLDEIGNTGSHSDADNIPEVHARDVDSRGPWPAGWSMERIVQTILARCRSGAEKRLLYIIFNGRIWEASNGWRQRTYTGADQHKEHAHFSLRYGSGSGTSNPENITAPWGFLAAYEEENVTVTPADITDIAEAVVKKIRTTTPVISDSDLTLIGNAVWNHTEDNPLDLDADGNPKKARVGGWIRLMEQRAAGRQAQLLGALGQDNVDEAAIAAAVLAGLTPEALGAAITAAGLTPEALAAAIPAELAGQVVDELGTRIARAE